MHSLCILQVFGNDEWKAYALAMQACLNIRGIPIKTIALPAITSTPSPTAAATLSDTTTAQTPSTGLSNPLQGLKKLKIHRLPLLNKLKETHQVISAFSKGAVRRLSGHTDTLAPPRASLGNKHLLNLHYYYYDYCINAGIAVDVVVVGVDERPLEVYVEYLSATLQTFAAGLSTRDPPSATTTSTSGFSKSSKTSRESPLLFDTEHVYF